MGWCRQKLQSRRILLWNKNVEINCVPLLLSFKNIKYYYILIILLFMIDDISIIFEDLGLKKVRFFFHFPNVQSNKDNVCWHDLWLLGTFNLMRRSPGRVSKNMSAEICINGKFWWDYLPNPCLGGFSMILLLSGQIIMTNIFCCLERLKFLALYKE